MKSHMKSHIIQGSLESLAQSDYVKDELGVGVEIEAEIGSWNVIVDDFITDLWAIAGDNVSAVVDADQFRNA